MMLRKISASSLLSYGKEGSSLGLSKLNVLIGANGSGKSNFIELLSLLQATPRKLVDPVREGGGIADWLRKDGNEISPVASLEAIVDHPTQAASGILLRHNLSFTARNQRFEIVDERIEKERPDPGHAEPYFYYRYQNGNPVLNIARDNTLPPKKLRALEFADISLEESILSQRKDPQQYPEITRLGEFYAKMRIYREWSFGRYAPPRLPQKADLPNDFLEEDGRNLGLVLNRIRREPDAKAHLLDALRILYEGIDDFDVSIVGGTVQIFLQEGRISVPATRLSDGTLRWLALLAILCHPAPAPVVCIEEPELGLHPDVLPDLAKLLKRASERCQIIATTHSDVLVDALDDPEDVVVCEKENGCTRLERLDAAKLRPWLETYSLGALWNRGHLGGRRW